MGKGNLVKVEWDVEANSDEYCTVWITYSIGDEKLRISTRLDNDRFQHLYVTNKDFWAMLRYMIGDTIEKEREDGEISMNKLKDIIQNTDHFYSDCWAEWLHDFAWYNNYGKSNEPEIKDFMNKVCDEYEEGSNLVGWF